MQDLRKIWLTLGSPHSFNNSKFFQDATLQLSHLYEFLSAGFVMREKRLRRKGGVIDTDRMMGGHTQKPRIICSQSVRGSLLKSFPQITTLSYWKLKQRSILANLGFFSWTIWVFHHSTTAF